MSTGSKLYIHFLQTQITVKWSSGLQQFSCVVPSIILEKFYKIKKPKQIRFYFPLIIYNT